MTTKELMLGDYITLADCLNDGKEPLIFKVVGLGYDGENSALVLLNGEKACDIVEIDDEWCGIPITPEVLEKNGFSQDSLNGHIFIFHEKSDEVIYYEYGTKYGLTIDNKLATIQDLKIRYAHELQHALKLCGIDKEIEL